MSGHFVCMDAACGVKPQVEQARKIPVDVANWQLLCGIWQLQSPKEVVQLLRDTHAGKVTPQAQQVLVECLSNNVCLQYAPERGYSSRLLRAIVLAVEEDREELVDQVADLHAQNLTGSHLQLILQIRRAHELADGWCYKTYAYNVEQCSALQPSGWKPLADHLKRLAVTQNGYGLAEEKAFGLITLKLAMNLFEGATGCHEWEAGFLLAEFILSNPGVFKGQQCLELGCGAGVVGVALSFVCAAVVQLTDGNAAAVRNCKHNLAINFCTSTPETPLADRQDLHVADSLKQEVGVMQMLWDKPCVSQPDIILAADILYDPVAIPSLIQLLKSMLMPTCTKSKQKDNPRKHCTAYIATTLRNQATLQLFLDHAVDADLHIDDVSSQARQSCVQFQHHVALRAHRTSIFVHKINAAQDI